MTITLSNSNRARRRHIIGTNDARSIIEISMDYFINETIIIMWFRLLIVMTDRMFKVDTGVHDTA